MRVFICWSGERSHHVARALHRWLPQVMQAVVPWISSEGIDKGADWNQKLAEELESTDFGVLCLAQDNLDARYILFEAGALAKSFGKASVCPLLIDIPVSAVKAPLSHFQATKLEKEDICRLVQTINGHCGDRKLGEEMLRNSFEKWWDEFAEEVKQENLPPLEIEEGAGGVLPDREEVLEELIALARRTDSRIAEALQKVRKVTHPQIRTQSIVTARKMADDATAVEVVNNALGDRFGNSSILDPDDQDKNRFLLFVGPEQHSGVITLLAANGWQVRQIGF